MFYVYVLKSTVNNDLYVGFSKDLKTRVKTHNAGHVRSTKAYVPWNLVYYEAYKDERDAITREKELKEHQEKDSLKKKIVFSLGALAKW